MTIIHDSASRSAGADRADMGRGAEGPGPIGPIWAGTDRADMGRGADRYIYIYTYQSIYIYISANPCSVERVGYRSQSKVWGVAVL